MNISVYAHIHKDTEVTMGLRDGTAGRYAVLEAGGLSVFINDREKLLEIASLLEKAAQQWEEGES